MPHINEEEISSYLDHQLNAEESRALEAHLAQCENCRALYDEMLDVSRMFREAERFEPSSFLWNRIEAELESKKPAAFGWRERISASLCNFSWSGGAVVAALAILLAVGITVFHSNSSRVTDQVALAEIDHAYKSLAAQDPDKYNPFSSSVSYGSDFNPFRNSRLSGKTGSARETVPQH